MPPKKDLTKTAYALPELTSDNQAVIVPLSIGTEYHRNPSLLKSFFNTLGEKTQLGHIKEVTLIIGDTLQAYNLLFNVELATAVPALPTDETSIELKTTYLTALDQWHISNNESITAAKTTALQKGTAWLIENKTNIKNLKRTFSNISSVSGTFTPVDEITNVTLLRWNDCLKLNAEDSKNVASKIRDAYIHNESFSRVINQLVREVSDRKSLPDATEAQKSQNQMCCTAYVFEELTIFSKWMQANQWDCMIYPFNKSPLNNDVFNLLTAISAVPAESKTLMAINALITSKDEIKRLKESDITRLKLAKTERDQLRQVEPSSTETITSACTTSSSSSESSHSRHASKNSSQHSSPKVSPGTSPPNDSTIFLNLFFTAAQDPAASKALRKVLDGVEELQRLQRLQLTKANKPPSPPKSEAASSIHESSPIIHDKLSTDASTSNIATNV